jgi:hypothetical protein
MSFPYKIWALINVQNETKLVLIGKEMGKEYCKKLSKMKKNDIKSERL